MGQLIPTPLYSEIHKNMPITCVDVVVLVEHQILMVRRKVEPVEGQWWFPGGRLLRNEPLLRAPARVVRDEVGIAILTPIFLSYAETMFETDPFGHGLGTHTVNLVFAARTRAIDIMAMQLDANHSEAALRTPAEIYEGDFHPYIKRFVAMTEGVH